MRFRIILALVCMTTPIAHAAANLNTGSITLEQVMVKVLEDNPQLGINDFEAKAAAARIRQAQQATPLEFKVELENLVGSGSYRGIDQLETTLSLAKVLEPNDSLTSRSNVAHKQQNLLSNRQDSKRLDLLAQATAHFIHLVVDQHRLQIARDHLALMQHTLEIVSQRVSAGRSHRAEQGRLNIEVVQAEIELEHAEHELLSSRLKLATSWGETQAQFTHAEADLFQLPPVGSFAQLETLLEHNPDLTRFATEERLSQARLRLAQSRRAPGLALSGGIRYLNEPNDAALMFSVSMPFGASTRAKPEIDEMQYLSQSQPLRYEQQRLALYTSLYEIYQELLHAQTAYEALNQRIIPEAQQLATDYQQGYQTGRFSLLELNEAQGTLLEAQMERVMAAANYHSLKTEIERLTGAALNSGE